MATTTTPLMGPRQRPPSRLRCLARELARLRRAEALYERRSRPAARSDEDYRWYRQYLLDEYPAYIG